MLACSGWQAPAHALHVQPRPSIICPIGRPSAPRHCSAVCSSCSQAAALQADAAPGYHHLQLQQHLQTIQGHQGLQQQQLRPTIHSSNTYELLLSVAQQHGRALSADDITSLLYKAAMLAKSAKRLHGMNAAAKRTRSKGASSSGNPYTGQDSSMAQQLVSLCLQRLLDVHHYVTAQHLSNCLLSLAVLCSRGGPAAAAFAGSSSTSSSQQRQLTDNTHGQQHQDGGPGLLQQLITPASSRALEQLLEAAAPQHQLQQLLELTCTSSSSSSSCMAHAELHQLVNTVYGLAVLPLRPAPRVLQELLHHTQQHMQQLLATSTPDIQQQQQQHSRVPKLLSQLLWSAATLQIQLPASWLDCFWSASSLLLPLFSAQDVANTVWAAAALKLEPPAAWQAGLVAQVHAVSGHMTGQGIANTLWGLAGINPAAVGQPVLLQLLQCSVKAAKGSDIDRQNMANIFWSVAKCCTAVDRRTENHQAVVQQLQQLLTVSSSILPSLQPRDWAELLWSCGQLGLNPGSSVVKQLWRRTPAGFHTSLNPHSLVMNSSRSRSSTPGSSGWSPQALGMCLVGFARIRAQPTAIWLQGFEVASVSLLPGFTTQLLANTLWALGRLRYRPSDTWMQQYWQQADRLLFRLQQATAVAEVDSHWQSEGQSLQQQQQQRRREAEAAAAEAVMVLQAVGRLHVVPPQLWLQQAVALVTAAVGQVHLPEQVHCTQQQQQQQDQPHSSVQLKTVTSFIHALSRLLHNASRSSSTSSSSVTSSGLAPADVERLIQCAVQPAGSSSSSLLPTHLSHLDILMLLSALPLLPHSSAPPATDIAVLVLARCWQLLAVANSSSSSSSMWTGTQLVQVAVSMARVVWYVTVTSSSSSSKQHHVVAQLWDDVADLLQQAGCDSSSSSSNSLLAVLCGHLEQHMVNLAPADVSKCLAAVAQLHSSSSTSTSSSSVSLFTAAAGEAVGHHMAAMSPHQRAAAAASLAQLGYCPTAAWLELLLLHSSCQLSGDTCSSKCMILLLQSMPVLLHNHTAEVGSTAAANAGQTALPTNAVAGWLRDWLDESSMRMSQYSASQLVATAAALQKALSCIQQQQMQVANEVADGQRNQWPYGMLSDHDRQRQQQQLQLPSAWRAAFLSAVQQQLPTLSPAELVSMLSFAHRLQLKPSHGWCAAVVAEAAARAIGTPQQQQQQQQGGSISSCQLKVHHVALLAYTFKRLAYRPPWPCRQVLLNSILAQCRTPDSSSAKPQELTQLIRLLSLSGWYPSREWIRYFKRSKAGRKLRLYLSKKRHRGSWRQLERRLRSWEQLAADRQRKHDAVRPGARLSVLRTGSAVF